jgi:3-methyladenine DNA glycosylase/8-oxoguanine DNA glycosylase
VTSVNDRAQRIAAADPVFTKLIEVVGPPPARRSAPVAERFGSLVRSITFQLLATSAANTIHQRVVAVCDGAVSVESVLGAGPDRLKAAGLNQSKANAMVELASHVSDGRINLDAHGRRSDEEIIAELSAVKGIGPWTAQMYLMHTLGRHDVWPVGDFGVRHGWSLLHGLEETISQRDLRDTGAVFTGDRSSVAWYCWQAVHVARSAK